MKIIAAVSDHSAAVYSLSQGTDAFHFFSGSGDRFVVRWSVDPLRQTGFSVRVNEPVYALHCCPEKQELVIGTGSGSIHVVDIPAKKEIRHFKIHDSGIFCFQPLPQQHLLLATSGDGSISVWDTRSWDLLRHIPLGTEKIRCASLSPDQQYLALGDNNGIIHILETSFFNEVHTLQASTEGITSVSFHPSKPVLLCGSRDAHLRVYNTRESYREITSIPAHKSSIYTIAFSPDKKHFVTASRDKSVKLWDADTLDFLSKTEIHDGGHTHSVNAALWLDNDRFVTAGDDRRIHIMQLTD